MSSTVFTIGHSNHPIEHFVGLLKQHAIEALADVRSAPYSRMNPQYKKQPLRASLLEADIQYVFLGKELGARSEDPDCYVNGQVQYHLLARTELFRAGLHRVIDGTRQYRIALMCAEKEPLQCHRTILVARELERRDVNVVHILADGTLERHDETIDRLARQLGLSEDDLFSDTETAREAAYAKQAETMAHGRRR